MRSPRLALPAVGPFSNPSETYQYYDLPFCAPPEKDNKLLTLGEVS
jgi:transmembrane 9 superfamily protein 1